jgi:hypothetical protein
MGSENFKYLDEMIHSGAKEIVLDSDIVFGDGEESEYLEGIKLDVDDLTIDGNGYTIDALGKARIFYCTGKNVIIKNIILKNGFAEEDGGAIYNSGELTVTESTINSTAQKESEAIYNDDGEITITSSTLNNNIAEQTKDEEYGTMAYVGSLFLLIFCLTMLHAFTSLAFNSFSMNIYFIAGALMIIPACICFVIGGGIPDVEYRKL